MTRDEAIRLICSRELPLLTREERAEQLDTMMLEDWPENPEWCSLPQDIRAEFAEQHDLRDDPCADRYDAVLMVWLVHRYRGARNEYLLDRLRAYGCAVRSVDGVPAPLFPCPCCGYRTLDHLGEYDICRVCWWEDDGQDNGHANEVFGGPNYHLSLTGARVNFLREGISDPSRDDLRKCQEPPEKYDRGRWFELSADGNGISEPASGWHASLPDEVT